MTTLYHYRKLRMNKIIFKINITLPRHKNYLKASSTLTNKSKQKIHDTMWTVTAGMWPMPQIRFISV